MISELEQFCIRLSAGLEQISLFESPFADKSDAAVTSPFSQHSSPETIFFLIKNQAGPKAQPQKDKCNARLTNPMSQHPIPETIMISHQE